MLRNKVLFYIIPMQLALLPLSIFTVIIRCKQSNTYNRNFVVVRFSSSDAYLSPSQRAIYYI